MLLARVSRVKSDVGPGSACREYCSSEKKKFLNGDQVRQKDELGAWDLFILTPGTIGRRNCLCGVLMLFQDN